MERADNELVGLGSFDFTPDWAKKDAGVVVGKTRSGFGMDDKRAQGAARPARGGAEAGGGKGGGFRKPFDKKPFDRKPRFEEKPKPLDAEVKILPDTKALGTIIRKLQQDIHAYKLKDLAYFFLDNPSSVLLKIVMKDGTRFHQCKACGFAALNEAEVIDHIISAHLSDYYTAKEVECEPPKGNFNCVAKCGLSGVLLGPPNVHEFNATVKEMIRTRYPNMSEADYRSRIVMVRETEAIEEWRKGATKKTVFVPKGATEGEAVATLTREQAESNFRRTILPSMLDTPKNLMITADVAMKSPLKPLQWAAKDTLEAERRAPYNICFALRGAFHHRKLKFFRANDSRGPEFVTNVEYKTFDCEHAIPELAKVAAFIAENPCSARNEIITDPEIEKHLTWLVSTGHVVAFTNGVYSAVEKFPKYGPQWRNKKKGKKGGAAEASATPAPEPATGAVESAAEAPLGAEAPEGDKGAETAQAPLNYERQPDALKPEGAAGEAETAQAPLNDERQPDGLKPEGATPAPEPATGAVESAAEAPRPAEEATPATEA